MYIQFYRGFDISRLISLQNRLYKMIYKDAGDKIYGVKINLLLTL